MATASLTHTQGRVSAAIAISCHRAETLTLTVTMLTAAGVARDCSGGIVALAFWRRGNNGSPLTSRVVGTGTGVHVVTIDRDTTVKLDGRYECSILYTAASGEVETLCDVGSLSIPVAVGGIGYDITGVSTPGAIPVGGLTVDGSPCNTINVGSDFPITVSGGIAELDQHNRIPHAQWRAFGASETATLTTDAAASVYEVTYAKIAALGGLAVSASHTYSALLSSRVTLRAGTACAWVDLLTQITITVDALGALNFAVDDALSASTVVGPVSLQTSRASVSQSSAWAFDVNITRPTGVECAVLRHDTAVLELQEIA